MGENHKILGKGKKSVKKMVVVVHNKNDSVTSKIPKGLLADLINDLVNPNDVKELLNSTPPYQCKEIKCCEKPEWVWSKSDWCWYCRNCYKRQ